MTSSAGGVDRFELIAQLASGERATVFLARADERLVSLVRCHGDPSRWRPRAAHTGAAFADIDHDNVVRTLEAGDGYVVVDHIEGNTLERLLDEAAAAGIALPVRTAVKIVLDALAGLHALHAQPDDAAGARERIHGEISPQTIVVGMDGASRIAELAVSEQLGYMAPEQLAGAAVDRRVDVFAIAVVLWECLARQPLFARDTVAATIDQVLYVPVPDLAATRPDLHPALARVCARGLDRDPMWRYASAAEFLEALERAAVEADELGTSSDVGAFVDAVSSADISERREAVSAWIAGGGRRLAIGTDPPRMAPDDANVATLAPARSAPPPPPAAQPTAPTPERFGKYAVIRHLASGGMADVYLARASGIEGFEKLVVIKCLKPAQMQDETATWLFLQEARIAATLEHPQIAQVYDVGEIDGSYFFAMEYVDGKDLRHVMSRAIIARRSLRLEESLRVVTELCAALHHAHEKLGPDREPLGLVHRDVSPSNVLVSYGGAVKLCDFGVAEVAAASKDPRRRTQAGKLSYMSPEQLRAEPLDRRSDIFGLSVMLYELTTLTKLFRGNRERGIVNQILEGRITPPSHIVPDYPRELERIVLKGLHVDRDDRYATAQEMQLELEAFAREHKLAVSAMALTRMMKSLFDRGQPGVVAEDAEDAWPMLEIAPPRRGYRAWLAAAAVAAIAAAATVPVDSWRRGPGDELAGELQASGDRIGAHLGSELRSVRTRADSLATTPMLRAAITTDTQTMEDMVGRESLFSIGAGDTVEFLRWTAGGPTSLLRVPAANPPAARLRGRSSQLELADRVVRVTASAPLVPLYRADGVDGALVMVRVIEPATIARELPAGTINASITGGGRSLQVAGGAAAPSGPSVTVPIRIDGEPGLSPLVLVAALPPLELSWLDDARNIALALALACCAGWAIARRRYWRSATRSSRKGDRT